MFVALVFNQMVMPILVQANFSKKFPNTWFDFLFSSGGRNSDFGSTWYQDMGTQLVLSLFLTSLIPIIVVLIDSVQYNRK
jgi:hypothetical protein